MTNTSINLNSQTYRTEAKPQHTPKCEKCGEGVATYRQWDGRTNMNVCRACLKGAHENA